LPRSTGSTRYCGSTCRPPSAAAHRVSCAWVISLQACPAPCSKEAEAKPIRRSPNGAAHTCPHPSNIDRDRPERVIGINWNDCSGSIGTGARNQSVHARETPRLRSPDLSYAHGPGTKCQWMPGSASSGRGVFGLVLGLPGGLTVADPLSRDRSGRGGLRIGQAACRRRDDCFSSIVAILMRLLASTAAPTHNSKRSRPSARQRFMPRPRNSTEMRPSMPARKR